MAQVGFSSRSQGVILFWGQDLGGVLDIPKLQTQMQTQKVQKVQKSVIADRPYPSPHPSPYPRAKPYTQKYWFSVPARAILQFFKPLKTAAAIQLQPKTPKGRHKARTEMQKNTGMIFFCNQHRDNPVLWTLWPLFSCHRPTVTMVGVLGLPLNGAAMARVRVG